MIRPVDCHRNPAVGKYDFSTARPPPSAAGFVQSSGWDDRAKPLSGSGGLVARNDVYVRWQPVCVALVQAGTTAGSGCSRAGRPMSNAETNRLRAAVSDVS